MKKITSLITLVIICVLMSLSYVSADNLAEVPKVKVNINSKAFKSKDVIINLDGRLLLPFRELFNALGVTDENISWDGRKKEVQAIVEDTTIKISIGSNKVYVNNEGVLIDTKAIIHKDRTYVPLRFVAQSLGKVVTWDGITSTVSIMNKDSYSKVKDLLEEVVENQEKIFKDVTIEYQINASSKNSKGVFSTVAYIGETQIDLVEKVAHVDFNVAVNGLPIDVEYYVIGQDKYKLKEEDDSWIKTRLTELESKDVFNGLDIYSMFSLILEDELISSIEIEENDDQYILSGNTIVEAIIKLVSSKDSNYKNTYNAEKSIITIDKASKTIKSILMQLNKDFVVDGEKSDLKVQAKYNIKSYNEGLSINLTEF